MKKTLWLSLAALALSGTPGLAAGSERMVRIEVNKKGFVPAEVKLKAGEPVRLVVTRTVEKTCATEIVIKDFGIDRPLPLGRPVEIAFTPRKTGHSRFACSMDMIHGVLVVE